MDYSDVDTILNFDACKRKSCVNVSIVEDVVLEKIELFNVTLERTPGLDRKIELTPVNGGIEIIDSNGMCVLQCCYSVQTTKSL